MRIFQIILWCKFSDVFYEYFMKLKPSEWRRCLLYLEQNEWDESRKWEKKTLKLWWENEEMRKWKKCWEKCLQARMNWVERVKELLVGREVCREVWSLELDKTTTRIAEIRKQWNKFQDINWRANNEWWRMSTRIYQGSQIAEWTTSRFIKPILDQHRSIIPHSEIPKNKRREFVLQITFSTEKKALWFFVFHCYKKHTKCDSKVSELFSWASWDFPISLPRFM